MKSFPLYLDLEKGTVLLTGSGYLLRQRLGKLRTLGAELRIFTEDDLPEETVIRGHMTEADLEDQPLFVAAAGLSEQESRRVFALCTARGIPVNVADMPKLCTFYFPAVLQRGALTVAVGTNGVYPAAAALIRDRLEERIPDRTEEILLWAQTLRLRLREQIPDAKLRSTLLRQLMADALEQNRPLTEEELQNHLYA